MISFHFESVKNNKVQVFRIFRQRQVKKHGKCLPSGTANEEQSIKINSNEMRTKEEALNHSSCTKKVFNFYMENKTYKTECGCSMHPV